RGAVPNPDPPHRRTLMAITPLELVPHELRAERQFRDTLKASRCDPNVRVAVSLRARPATTEPQILSEALDLMVARLVRDHLPEILAEAERPHDEAWRQYCRDVLQAAADLQQEKL